MTVTVEVSQDRALSQYSYTLKVVLDNDTPLVVSWGAELFELEELYFGDGVEMSDHWLVTLEGETAWSLLIHITVLKPCLCVQLEKVPYIRVYPYDYPREL